MEKAYAPRFFGMLLLAGSAAVLIAPACGEVTAAGPEQQQDLCTDGRCDGGSAGASAAGDCATSGMKRVGNVGKKMGRGCATGTGGGVAARGSGGGGGTGAGIPTEVILPPCTVCRRAENCCKAEGLSDCNYTAACTSATMSEQMQFYLVLCRAVLEASSAGPRTPPTVCGTQ